MEHRSINYRGCVKRKKKISHSQYLNQEILLTNLDFVSLNTHSFTHAHTQSNTHMHSFSLSLSHTHRDKRTFKRTFKPNEIRSFRLRRKSMHFCTRAPSYESRNQFSTNIFMTVRMCSKTHFEALKF